MIKPISSVSFKGNMFEGMTGASALDKVTNTMRTVTNITSESKEIQENIKKDQEAYTDAFVNLAEKAEETKVLQPIAKVVDTKAGKAVTGMAGKFIAWCTGLAGAATSISNVSN